MSFRVPARVLLALLLALGLATIASAEGKVSGTIKDASGTALQGVVVQLRPTKSSEPSLEAKTNKKGQYLFALVRAGQYTLQATQPGKRVSAIDVQQRDNERKMKLQKAEPVAAGSPMLTLDIAGTDVIVYNLVLSDDTAGGGSTGTGVPLLGSGQIVELIQGGQMDKARTEIDRALSTDPQNASMLYLRAYVEMQAGNVDAALTAADALLQANPSFGGAHLLRGTLLEKKGDADGALAEYRKEAEGATDPNVQRDAWVHIAMLTKSKGQNDESLTALRKIVELDPANVVAYSQLIDHYTETGDVEQLSTLLETAPDELRNDPNVHFNLGAALYNKGQAERAAQEFEKVISLKPDFSDAYKHLAYCKVTLNDYPGAVSAGKKFLELTPSGPEADEMRKLVESLEKRAAK
jgi:tetratricopeptide (TPR) repeat protein